MIIGDLIGAFRAGKELRNAVTWKNAQLRVSLLVTILSAALGVAKLFGYDLNLSVEEITSIAVAVGVVGGLLNGGTTVATTTRIGLPSKSDGESGGRGGDKTVVEPVAGKPRPPTFAPKIEPAPEPPPPDFFGNRSLG